MLRTYMVLTISLLMACFAISLIACSNESIDPAGEMDAEDTNTAVEPENKEGESLKGGEVETDKWANRDDEAIEEVRKYF